MTEPIRGKRRGCTRLPEVVILLQNATLAYMYYYSFRLLLVISYLELMELWSGLECGESG
ncbi:hypothetical protein M6B38_123470 [Iris pallida]|uniref:Uncharacterized protein n=1 Tax=Iris pallida TaxID=29817 RepID=A0AAX6H2I8_IRIPA|nr:hypothetical protein M6B38_123470 [Iris pallida]